MRMVLPDFSYRASDGRIEENEFCPVLVCRIVGEPRPAPDEVGDVAWWSWPDSSTAAADPDSGLSPWAATAGAAAGRGAVPLSPRAKSSWPTAGVLSAGASSTSLVTVFQFRMVTAVPSFLVPVDLAEGRLGNPVRAPQVQVIADQPGLSGAVSASSASSGTASTFAATRLVGEEAEEVLGPFGRRSSRRDRRPSPRPAGRDCGPDPARNADARSANPLSTASATFAGESVVR